MNTTTLSDTFDYVFGPGQAQEAAPNRAIVLCRAGLVRRNRAPHTSSCLHTARLQLEYYEMD